jgi:hypothetical protein
LQSRIKYLGREIFPDDIKPSQTKVKQLIDVPAPSNVKQVSQFVVRGTVDVVLVNRVVISFCYRQYF